MANIIDKKIANAKVNQAMDMLKNKSPEEIKRKLGNMKREDLIKQLDQIDAQTIKSLNIDTEKIKRTLTKADMEKIKAVAGKDSDVVMKKLNELLGNK
ncbi:MAG: hypothetical protein E7384_05345 [Ruminococcaceae bacterium]|nr:hypothetical protein [Oscillospiraceae bacterium]